MVAKGGDDDDDDMDDMSVSSMSSSTHASQQLSVDAASLAPNEVRAPLCVLRSGAPFWVCALCVRDVFVVCVLFLYARGLHVCAYVRACVRIG